MSAFNLNGWLRKSPQPVSVVVDDKTVTVPKTGRVWRELTDTIAGMNPTKITLLDGQGQVLRVKVIEGDAVEGSEDKGEVAGDLQVLAKLLTNAYHDSSQERGRLLDSALAMVERQSTHIGTQERTIERIRNENVRLQAALAAAEIELASIPELPEGGEEGNIVTALAHGLMQGQAAKNVRPIKKGETGK